MALVEASLGQLNERYRTALVLKDLQGLAPAEIAEVMEVSRPNADVLVHRARASFKTAFAKLAGDVPGAGRSRPRAPAAQPAGGAAGDAVVRRTSVAPPARGATPRTRPSATACTSPHLSHAGPAGAGLLAKIGAALTTKIGITAAAATLVIGGTVAVKEVQHAHAHPWTGSPGHAWQAPSSKWSKHWARWSLYGHWMKHGWPMGWNSGRWSWNGRMRRLVLAHGQRLHVVERRQTSGSSSWSGGSWTMSTSRLGSSGWSSGGSWTRLGLEGPAPAAAGRAAAPRTAAAPRAAARRRLARRLRRLGQRLRRLRHGRRLVPAAQTGAAGCEGAAATRDAGERIRASRSTHPKSIDRIATLHR